MSSNLPQPPDFDDMFNLTKVISRSFVEAERLDIEIKAREAEIVKIVTTDTAYFQSGKVPSMEFIKSTWKFSGLTGELIPLRQRLAELQSFYEEAKLRLQVMRDMVSVYITESANHRSITL